MEVNISRPDIYHQPYHVLLGNQCGWTAMESKIGINKINEQQIMMLDNKNYGSSATERNALLNYQPVGAASSSGNATPPPGVQNWYLEKRRVEMSNISNISPYIILENQICLKKHNKKWCVSRENHLIATSDCPLQIHGTKPQNRTVLGHFGGVRHPKSSSIWPIWPVHFSWSKRTCILVTSLHLVRGL